MRLLLIRHAEAGEKDPARWPDDRDRPITDEGRAIHARASETLRARGWTPDVLLTSPWTRARQSAEITAERLGLPRLFESEGLAMPPNLARIQEAVGARPARATVALVGHSPFLDQLAAQLLGGRSAKLRFEWAKSGAMVLDADRIAAGSAALVAFLPPP